MTTATTEDSERQAQFAQAAAMVQGVDGCRAGWFAASLTPSSPWLNGPFCRADWKWFETMLRCACGHVIAGWGVIVAPAVAHACPHGDD